MKKTTFKFKQLARDSFCYKKKFVLKHYSRYVSHTTNNSILKNQIFKYKETGSSTNYLKTLVCLKMKAFFCEENLHTKNNCV